MSKPRPVNQLNELYNEFQAGKVSRRQAIAKAGTIGLSAAGLSMFARALPASAQDSTPETVALPGGFKSLTREEANALLTEDFPFISEQRTPGGTLIMGSTSSSNLTTTNAFFASNFPTQDVLGLVFEQLWSLNPNPARNAENAQAGRLWLPRLADYFEIADDGRTYTFHINPDATFHDGTPVTANDVVMVAEAQSNENSGSQYVSTFLQTIESWSAVDDKTFQWVTIDVFPQIAVFPNVVLYVLPTSIWGEISVTEWQTDPGSTGTDPSRVVGSGPFKFVELNESEGTTTFVRNDAYYDTTAALETVIFQVWPDNTSLAEALRADELDFIMDPLDPQDVESLQAEDHLDVKIYDNYAFGFMGFNLDLEKTTLFQDLRVRQAMMYALDRESMVENILLGYGEVARGTQPTLSEAYAPDQIRAVYDYDPDKAAAVLDEAGWILGSDGIREKDGQKLSFEVMYATDTTNDRQAAAMQDFWRAVGIDGQPTPVDFDTVLFPAITETFDFETCFLGLDFSTPSGDQTAMFHTDSYGGGGLNFMKYSNPEYDEVAIAANLAVEPAERFRLLVEASNIVNDDLPVIIFWFRKDRVGYNVRMKNFTPTPAPFVWSLPFVSIAE